MPLDSELNALFQSAKKRTQNEVAFQKTNNILVNQAKKLVALADRDKIAFAFTCECSNMKCHEDIHLSITDFERISDHAAWFAVKPGHNQPI